MPALMAAVTGSSFGLSMDASAACWNLAVCEALTSTSCRLLRIAFAPTLAVTSWSLWVKTTAPESLYGDVSAPDSDLPLPVSAGLMIFCRSAFTVFPRANSFFRR